jgi:rubredoxin
MSYCRCPRCQSPNAVSNKFEEEQLERAGQIAQATQAFGIKRLTVLAGLGALALRGVNAWRKDWRCLDCGYLYDA